MAEQITQVLGIVGIKHCGDYDATIQYEKLNVVTYNGSSYCAKGNTLGNLPTNTTYWDLMAEKGDKGDTGDTGAKPVKGVDYWTAIDIAQIENTLSSDVTDEVSDQLSTLTSATPLAASSTASMTDTTRIYVNTTDGHWYWYDGDSWEDGGVYQSSVNSKNEVLNKNVIDYDTANLKPKSDVTLFKQTFKVSDFDLYADNKVMTGTDKTMSSNNAYAVYKINFSNEIYYQLIKTSETYNGYMSIDIEGVETLTALSSTFLNSIRQTYQYVNPNNYKINCLYVNLKKSQDETTKIELYSAPLTNELTDKLYVNHIENIITPYAVINSNTSTHTTNNYFVSKIPINHDYNYYLITGALQYKGCCYDKDDNYLSNISVSDYLIPDTTKHLYTLNIANNCAYILLNCAFGSQMYCEKKDKIQKKLFATSLHKPYDFKNKTAAFFGDSITWLGGTTTSYSKVFADLNNMTFQNYGVDGSCLANLGHGATPSIIDKVKATNLTNTDFIFIAGGVNDCMYNSDIGSITDTNDTVSFYGALNNLANYLKTNYTTKEVIFILPIYNSRTSTWGSEPLTHSLDDYREAIYNVAIENGFSVVNGLDFAIPSRDSTIYTDIIYDNTHPSELGRKIYGESLSSILN